MTVTHLMQSLSLKRTLSNNQFLDRREPSHLQTLFWRIQRTTKSEFQNILHLREK